MKTPLKNLSTKHSVCSLNPILDSYVTEDTVESRLINLGMEKNTSIYSKIENDDKQRMVATSVSRKNGDDNSGTWVGDAGELLFCFMLMFF